MRAIIEDSTQFSYRASVLSLSLNWAELKCYQKWNYVYSLMEKGEAKLSCSVAILFHGLRFWYSF